MKSRLLTPERMDDPNLDPREHGHALAGLRRINALSWVSGFLLRAMRPGAGRPQTLRVLDLACGGGDVSVALWERARRAGLRLDVLGVDVSARAVEMARDLAARRRAAVRFRSLDVLNDALPTGYDVVMSNLFLHHLGEADAVRLLRRMAAAAGRLLLIDDLVRSRTGLALATLAPRLLTASPVVHEDACRSVRAAFVPSEVVALARRAGVRDPHVRRHFPSRFLLIGRPLANVGS